MRGVHMIENAARLRDLSPDLINAEGRYIIPPASYFASTTAEERMLFCVRHAIYGLHTQELLDFLLTVIADRRAIEIGAGNGALGMALNIPATDNFMQDRPEIASLYHSMGQPTISYGEEVHNMEAIEAIRRMQPEVVIGSWITHKYNPRKHECGGNMYAPDENKLLEMSRTLILIGNEGTHKDHPLLQKHHFHLCPDWLYSRAPGAQNFIGIWGEWEAGI